MTPKRRRFAALATAGALAVLTGGCDIDDNPYETEHVTDERKAELTDGMRIKGSAEAARRRLTEAARVIADHIATAIPGTTWRFVDNDPHGNMADVYKGGSFCAELGPEIAWRPAADRVVFGRSFSAEEFATAADIVRQAAAQYGATEESSLFDEQSKRDYDVQGNGYQFQLGQIDLATLEITGDCFLLQRVLDLPSGQLPSEPPIVPTNPTPTP